MKIEKYKVFNEPCFIKKNSLKLRDKLKAIGYEERSIESYLSDYDIVRIYYTLNIYKPSHYKKKCLYCNGKYFISIPYFLINVIKNNSINCHKNEELFLAIAALRDNTNEHQWFVWDDDSDKGDDKFKKFDNDRNWCWWIFECHKATVSELVEYFNKK